MFVLGGKERWRRDKPPIEALQAFEKCLRNKYIYLAIYSGYLACRPKGEGPQALPRGAACWFRPLHCARVGRTRSQGRRDQAARS